MLKITFASLTTAIALGAFAANPAAAEGMKGGKGMSDTMKTETMEMKDSMDKGMKEDAMGMKDKGMEMKNDSMDKTGAMGKGMKKGMDEGMKKGM